MGYVIEIETDKEFTEESLNSIVGNLPEELKGFNSKQTWGWSLATDVKLNVNRSGSKIISVSGSSSMSGDKGFRMAAALYIALNEKGFNACINRVRI